MLPLNFLASIYTMLLIPFVLFNLMFRIFLGRLLTAKPFKAKLIDKVQKLAKVQTLNTIYFMSAWLALYFLAKSLSTYNFIIPRLAIFLYTSCPAA